MGGCWKNINWCTIGSQVGDRNRQNNKSNERIVIEDGGGGRQRK